MLVGMLVCLLHLPRGEYFPTFLDGASVLSSPFSFGKLALAGVSSLNVFKTNSETDPLGFFLLRS